MVIFFCHVHVQNAKIDHKLARTFGFMSQLGKHSQFAKEVFYRNKIQPYPKDITQLFEASDLDFWGMAVGKKAQVKT